MKITSISLKNFLGIRSADIALDSPVVLLCGANGCGKTSVRDAVEIALTGELSRVALKRDAGALVADGAASAQVTMTIGHDDGEDERKVSITKAGKVTHSHRSEDRDPALTYLLQAQRFALLPADQRRMMLFGLMRIATDPKGVAARMAKRGLDAKFIERITPFLRSGFDAALSEAKSKASDARGAWKALTGEAYGSSKADSWSPDIPSFNQSDLDAAIASVAELDARVQTIHAEVGHLRALQHQRDEIEAGITSRRAVAERVPGRREKVARDQAELAAWEIKLTEVAAAAGTAPRAGLLHDLAVMLDRVVRFLPPDFEWLDEARAVLVRYESEHGRVIAPGSVDAAARERLPQVTSTRDMMRRSLANSQRDVAESEAAAAQITLLEEQRKATPAPEGLLEAEGRLQAEQQHLALARASVDALLKRKDAADGATAVSVKAASHHAAVQAWEAIAEAVGPSGIPAELLAEALGPLNDRLRQSALDSGWPEVHVNADLDITYGHRTRALISESQQWRCDAMLAEAIAHLSGLRLLVLDRFDILDHQGRSECLSWLDAIATAGEVDTVLLLGTLKAPPTNLPDSMSVAWIERGTVEAQLPQAA